MHSLFFPSISGFELPVSGNPLASPEQGLGGGNFKCYIDAARQVPRGIRPHIPASTRFPCWLTAAAARAAPSSSKSIRRARWSQSSEPARKMGYHLVRNRRRIAGAKNWANLIAQGCSCWSGWSGLPAAPWELGARCPFRPVAPISCSNAALVAGVPAGELHPG